MSCTHLVDQQIDRFLIGKIHGKGKILGPYSSQWPLQYSKRHNFIFVKVQGDFMHKFSRKSTKTLRVNIKYDESAILVYLELNFLHITGFKHNKQLRMDEGFIILSD